jgi:hypothetical protein
MRAFPIIVFHQMFQDLGCFFGMKVHLSQLMVIHRVESMGGYTIEGVGIMGYGNMNGCLGSISLALFEDLTMVSYDRHPHPHLVICLNFGISRMEFEP